MAFARPFGFSVRVLRGVVIEGVILSLLAVLFFLLLQLSCSTLLVLFCPGSTLSIVDI